MLELSTVVIPVAGLGTRVLPASKAIPKEMLTVVDKPVIQYVVEEAIEAGFKNIILVTRSGKSSIEDHFDTNYELEAVLSSKGKLDLLNSIKDILPKDVSIAVVRQNTPLGLGHAVLCAAPAIGEGNNFAVMLPDEIIHPQQDQKSSDLSIMFSKFQTTGVAQIMVEEVPDDQVNRYGIVDCGGAPLESGASQPIKGMIEKPAIHLAPSNQSIIGRYILPYEVIEILNTIQPGAGGEVQLTDALDLLIKKSPAEAYSMRGKRCDCGNKFGFLQANIIFGLSHPEIKDDLQAYLVNL